MTKVEPFDFNEKYKTVISFKVGPEYMEMLNWVDMNSCGNICVQFDKIGSVVSAVHLGFESYDDALIFKIRYPI